MSKLKRPPGGVKKVEENQKTSRVVHKIDGITVEAAWTEGGRPVRL